VNRRIWTEEQYVAELARVARDHIVERKRLRGLKWRADGPMRAAGGHLGREGRPPMRLQQHGLLRN
jgi:hypothetical protein